ncbi:MAG: hypothetical protein QOF39_2583 [Frankiales bacterium]|nr:hypothetical protein [Frankiales bacterium]
MRQRLVAGLTTAMLSLALLPVLSQAAGAAPPVTAKLAIAVRPTPVLGHEVVTIVGHLSPVRAGRAVKLQRAAGKSWVTLGTAHTNAKSDYSIRTRVPLTGKEVLRTLLVASDGTQVISGSLTLTPVRPTISVNGVSWVLTGGTLHTSGTFLPRRPGRAVLLQRKAGGHWVTLATGRLDVHSRYVMNAPLVVPPGSASLRVVAAAFNGAPAAASPVHVLTVVGPAPALLGPLDAVYVGLKSSSTQGSYSQAAGSPALVFSNSGRVTSAVPADGPDAGAAPLPASVRTGVYFAHDGLVDIAWETDGTTVTLRPNTTGQLTWNGLTYGIVDPLQGAHLSGTYKRLSGGSGATITFKGNGRFADDGVTADTNLVGTDNPSGTGSYSVRANTVYLVYDSGPFESMAVYALPQYLGGKEQIVLGGATFRRLPAVS